MTAQASSTAPASPWLTTGGAGADSSATGRSSRSIGLLLVLVVAASSSSSRASSTATGSASTLRAAIPLAILAACQTLAMLTGGIDLSVGMVASMAAFLMATQTTAQGPAVAIVIALVAAAIAGLVNGIGIGVFRVHPLIMTLGMSLVVLGLMTVYQLAMVQSGVADPRRRSSGSAPGTTLGFLPNSLVRVRARSRSLIMRRPALQRLRAAAVRRRRQPDRGPPVGRPRRGRSTSRCTSCRRCWPASPASSSPAWPRPRAVSLVEQSVLPSVAAAVIGGTSIMGGRGGYSGTIVGALILTVADDAADGAADAGGRPPDPVRGDHRRPSRRPTRASPARRDRPRRGRRRPAPPRASTWAARTASGSCVEHAGDDVDACSIAARSYGRRGRAGRGRRPRSSRWAAAAARSAGRTCARSASASPGCTTRRPGTTRFLVNVPGGWDGVPVAGRRSRRRSACRSRSSTTPGRSGWRSCGWGPGAARARSSG